MLTKVREALGTSVGKIVSVVVSVVMLAIAGYLAMSTIQGDVPSAAYSTTYICTETLKPFRHRNQIGETQPILSPHSGKNTGVTAEACFWTRDGATKEEPTWVLLEELAGRPGPTFCPDCGRLVVPRNPKPVAGGKSPPTQGEYASRKTASTSAANARDDRQSR